MATRNAPAGAPFQNAGTPGHLIHHARDTAGPGLRILVPVLAGLSPMLADLAASLPMADANALLLSELDGAGEFPDSLVAGVFANDPFRAPDDLLTALKQRGISRVVNWPSVGLLGGELAAAYEHSGFTVAAELEWLRRAREAGLSALALVADAESAQAARAQGLDGLVVTPGLAVPDAERRRQAAEDTAALLQDLTRDPAAGPVWLYVHPDFDGWLDTAAAHADGVIAWGS